MKEEAYLYDSVKADYVPVSEQVVHEGLVEHGTQGTVVVSAHHTQVRHTKETGDLMVRL